MQLYSVRPCSLRNRSISSMLSSISVRKRGDDWPGEDCCIATSRCDVHVAKQKYFVLCWSLELLSSISLFRPHLLVMIWSSSFFFPCLIFLVFFLVCCMAASQSLYAAAVKHPLLPRDGSSTVRDYCHGISMRRNPFLSPFARLTVNSSEVYMGEFVHLCNNPHGKYVTVHAVPKPLATMHATSDSREGDLGACERVRFCCS